MQADRADSWPSSAGSTMIGNAGFYDERIPVQVLESQPNPRVYDPYSAAPPAIDGFSNSDNSGFHTNQAFQQQWHQQQSFLRIPSQPSSVSPTEREPSAAASSSRPRAGGLGIVSSGNLSRLPGACTHCKKLKMKCQFLESDDTCMRCKTGGHVCIVQSRRVTTQPNRREYLLEQIRQKDAIIESLLKQLQNPYIATPSSLASYLSLSDPNNKNISAWLGQSQSDGRPGDIEEESDTESNHGASRLTHAQRYGLVPVDADEKFPDTGPAETEEDRLQRSLPDSHVPLGLIANLSLDNNMITPGKDNGMAKDVDHDNVRVANATYYVPGPATDLDIRAMLMEQHSLPEILVHGLVNPDDVDRLFKIFYERLNPFISLLDPVLYTPAFTFARCPFLFTVVCAISSRYYTEKSEIYPIAMHFAKHSAQNTLIDGWKSVELCQAYILMSIYAVPARRWEKDQSWLYTGLAIRIATDLNLHQVSGKKPQNEKQEREILNNMRVWMICFNLDRSMATQFGKPVTIREDYIIRHSQEWYKNSEYNIQYDVHLCAHTALLRIVAKFHDEVFSDPTSPSGLNKQIDFRSVIITHDAQLTRFKEEWVQRFKDHSENEDRGVGLRVMLLPFLVAYSRLVMFSFGFQQAYQHGIQQTDLLFFNKCLESAKMVLKSMLEDLAPSGYMRYAPDEHFVFTTFASAFLLKLLHPEFAGLMPASEETEIFYLIGQLIQTLSSPLISIDDRHMPKLHARFLAGLLSGQTHSKTDIPNPIKPIPLLSLHLSEKDQLKLTQKEIWDPHPKYQSAQINSPEEPSPKVLSPAQQMYQSTKIDLQSSILPYPQPPPYTETSTRGQSTEQTDSSEANTSLLNEMMEMRYGDKLNHSPAEKQYLGKSLQKTGIADGDELQQNRIADNLGHASPNPGIISGSIPESNAPVSGDFSLSSLWSSPSSGPLSVPASSTALASHQIEPTVTMMFKSENISSEESATFVVAAVDALHHINKNMSTITSLMFLHGINNEDFTVRAGFNEDLIIRDVGHLQQIYLLMFMDLNVDPALQEGLGKIFSPYPGVIQMPSNSLQTPVFQDNGEEWDFDDLVLAKLQEFNESKVVNSDASSGLISIQGTNLAHTSQQYSGGLGDSSSSQSQNNGQENGGGSGDRDGNKGSGKDHHQEQLGGDRSSPEPNSSPSKKKESQPVARFLVEAKILRRSTDPYPFQTLTVQGILVTTHDDVETSHVHFRQLRSQSIQSKAGLATSAYQQYLAHLVIDSGCGRNAYVMNGSPKYTRASESRKMTTSQETGRIGQITGAVKGILAVPMTMELSGSASVSTKGTLTSESMKRTSCIIQKDFWGRIWWSFEVDDEYEQQHGLDITAENLPHVDFRLCPDLPVTLPDTVQVEVASYWKLPSPTKSWQSIFKPEQPELSFQNLCLVVAMQLPSNLKRSLSCDATLQKIPGRPEKPISYQVSPELSATARMQHIRLTEGFQDEGPEVPTLLDKITRHEFIAQGLIARPLPSLSSTTTNTQNHSGNIEPSFIQAGPSTLVSAIPAITSETSSAWLKGKEKELVV